MASTYIFGAICPQDGKVAGLILPWCNIEAMELHLAAISAKVAPGRHAALLLDQAGWHMSDRLAVPSNITIVSLWLCYRISAQSCWRILAQLPSLNLGSPRLCRGAQSGLERQSGFVRAAPSGA